MKINTIEVLNVMVFQQEQRHPIENNNGHHPDSFLLNFCDGINVLIGENGVGKTTLLKMIYGATQWSIKRTDMDKTKKLAQLFSNNLNDKEALKNQKRQNEVSFYKVSADEHNFYSRLWNGELVNYEEWAALNIQSVFIPTTEMLSHSKGFLALNEKYNMPFDGTQIDIIVNASLPEARNIPEAMHGILAKISNAIDGTVIIEDDSFYVIKKDGSKIDFSLEAEGLRKLGLLWKLIRNGLLDTDTILLWDEPEAHLNPELYPLVAEILIELQNNGVQIFMATHNYNFAKYLEIRRTFEEQVMFHNLFKNKANTISSKSAYKFEDLQSNSITNADIKLLDEVYNL